MVSRRTWARFVFISNLLLLPFRVLEWLGYQSSHDDNESIPLVPRWLVVGIGYRIAYNWAYDHDYGSIRTSLRRRALLSVPELIFGLLLASRKLPRSKAVLRNFSTGVYIGRISYRLWYGILHPLPGADE